MITVVIRCDKPPLLERLRVEYSHACFVSQTSPYCETMKDFILSYELLEPFLMGFDRKSTPLNTNQPPL